MTTTTAPIMVSWKQIKARHWQSRIGTFTWTDAKTGRKGRRADRLAVAEYIVRLHYRRAGREDDITNGQLSFSIGPKRYSVKLVERA